MSATEAIPNELAVLPTREAVLLPMMGLPATIAGQPLLQMLDEIVTNHVPVAIVAQKPSDGEAPTASGSSTKPAEDTSLESSAETNVETAPDPESLYRMGTAARIVRLQRMPGGMVQVLFQGIARIRLSEFTQTEPYLRARVLVVQEQEAPETPELEALRRTVLDLVQQVVALSPSLPDESARVAMGIADPNQLADFAASLLDLSVPEKQAVLETLDTQQRLRLVASQLEKERQVLELGRAAYTEISGKMQNAQREAFLRAQLEKIRAELNELDPQAAATKDLRERIASESLPDEARTEAERELERLAKLPEISPEFHLIRTYLDWLVSLPWNKSTEDNLDLAHAREVLDADHYGLDKVKDRILEYLAVRQLKPDPRGPILCFVGAPGVGKTSLGQSIARAVGRKFAHMSLGGMRDEAEIRGHRRTYVGAMPGRIIQAMRRAESNNPVFMLDEVDKLAVGFQGDPAAALLEVLDPEQNNRFVDHYLDVPFDLSRTLFIATANVLDTVPGPLRDRMEVIELPGYTEQEKIEIVRRHLLPKQLEAHGLKTTQLELQPLALRQMIRDYTREAGVRNLERELATICRKVARRLVDAQAENPAKRVRLHVRVTPSKLVDYLGPRRFREEVLEEADEVGVATALSVTPAGGEVLFIEASAAPGDGKLELTGQLGDVMKESARAALTYIRSRAAALGVPAGFPKRYDMHVHVPAGAVPKDGPSAGVALATALASALTHRRVQRKVAMTGEITLRGKVLPIGGVKEKVIAAHRAGVSTVLLPEENEKDLHDVPPEVQRDLRIVFVKTVDQVLEEALYPTRSARTAREGKPSRTRSKRSVDLPKAA
jgi:ATP-dependent Lon protease